MNTSTTQQIVLAARPNGKPQLTDFRLEDTAVPTPGAGQMLLGVQYLSLDPYMRGRIEDRQSYAKPLLVGEVMIGEAVARVLASKHPAYAAGDMVLAQTGWRTPVLSDGAGLRWLERATPDLDEAKQAVRRISYEGQRASDIIRHIRALAKKAPPQKDWLHVNELITEVLAFVRSELHTHQVVFHTQLAEELPAVRADRIQVQQVILNLVLNAIRALSTVAPPRELHIGSWTEGAQGVRISVRDSGIGIEPEKMEQLFKAFYTTKAEGMGMGLAISRSIIEAHGGRLWAEPNEPRGAVFQFTLPGGGESVT